MIVPVDGHWLNLMMGKRFHENLNSNSNSENDSTSSYESAKPNESDEQPSPPAPRVESRRSDTKEEEIVKVTNVEVSEAISTCETPVPSTTSLDPSSTQLAKTNANGIDTCTENIDLSTHTSRIATMNMEVSKLSTKNIIEHSKILSLRHMNRTVKPYINGLNEMESSGDETSSRGTLDAIIPPLKDFQGKNNPFLMQNTGKNSHRQNGRQNHFHSRFSLPGQFNVPLGGMGPFIRPMKRKLSEKDLIIGPNGEVKRRKFRRPKKYLQNQHTQVKQLILLTQCAYHLWYNPFTTVFPNS